jgi:hypothetical protein
MTEREEAAVESSSAASSYPCFSASHRAIPDGVEVLPFRKYHIEQNFYITKKNPRSNRQSDVDCYCAFCLEHFRLFTTTKMRVHLTGESQGDIRVAACKSVPDACKQFYVAERDRESAKAREKAAQRTKVYNDAAELSKTYTGKRKTMDVPCDGASGSLNPRSLIASSNLRNVTQPSIATMMVSQFFDCFKSVENFIVSGHVCRLLYGEGKSRRLLLNL